jgi:hypothetical protein
MSYTYITQEKIEVPAIRETEPALSELYLARRERLLREQKLFIGANRRRSRRSDKKSAPDYVEDYLKSAAQEIHHRHKSLKHQIFEIGKVFCDVKKFIPHGKFLAWVEQKTPYSISTAENLMRVYEACLGYPEVTQFFKPSELYVICQPSFPQEFREELFIKAYKERRENDIGRKKLLEILHKFKQGEIQIDSPEVQNLFMIEKDRDYFHLYKRELEAFQVILENRLHKFSNLHSKFISSPLLENDKDAKAEKYFEVLEMIKGFISDVKFKIQDINPDLNRNRKICENAKVTNSENHKITSSQRAEGLRMQTKQAVEDAALARKKRTRGKRFTRRN